MHYVYSVRRPVVLTRVKNELKKAYKARWSDGGSSGAARGGWPRWEESEAYKAYVLVVTYE